VRDLGELDAVVGERRQVGQRAVPLAEHEHPRERQSEKALQQVAVVGEVDHRLEDRPDRLGADLVGRPDRWWDGCRTRCLTPPRPPVVSGRADELRRSSGLAFRARGPCCERHGRTRRSVVGPHVTRT
jgi:hypothetical protein